MLRHLRPTERANADARNRERDETRRTGDNLSSWRGRHLGRTRGLSPRCGHVARKGQCMHGAMAIAWQVADASSRMESMQCTGRHRWSTPFAWLPPPPVAESQRQRQGCYYQIRASSLGRLIPDTKDVFGCFRCGFSDLNWWEKKDVSLLTEKLSNDFGNIFLLIFLRRWTVDFLPFPIFSIYVTK
jgi:hypothetical protein